MILYLYPAYQKTSIGKKICVFLSELKDSTFMARAMRAPSVGRPIRVLFLITASLHTQPACENSNKMQRVTAVLECDYNPKRSLFNPHLHNLTDGGVGETVHHLSVQHDLTGTVVPDTGDL